MFRHAWRIVHAAEGGGRSGRNPAIVPGNIYNGGMNAVSRQDINGLQSAGRAVRRAFLAMKRAARPGMTTAELDAVGAAALRQGGARSAPQLFYRFPGATCISINEEAAHGIPGERMLEDGDIVNIDVSAELNGYVADMGESFVVGRGHPERHRICETVQAAVHAAIGQVRAGRSLNVIGRTVSEKASQAGYRIVENLGSHGVGRSLHEDPSYVPIHNPNERRTLHKGMVLTIEPFFSDGATWVEEQPDGWTLSVPRGVLVAQFEHTLIVTDGQPIVVTA
jgi:methionyl aminopeptidase